MIFSNCLLHGGPKGLSGCPVEQPAESSCEGVRLGKMMVIMMVVVMMTMMMMVVMVVMVMAMVMHMGWPYIMWSLFALKPLMIMVMMMMMKKIMTMQEGGLLLFWQWANWAHWDDHNLGGLLKVLHHQQGTQSTVTLWLDVFWLLKLESQGNNEYVCRIAEPGPFARSQTLSAGNINISIFNILIYQYQY